MARITGSGAAVSLSQTLEAVRQSPAYDAFGAATACASGITWREVY